MTAAKKPNRDIKRKLVLPLLNEKMATGDEIAILVKGPIYEGRPQKDMKEGEKPADLMPCINIDTGEEGAVIVPIIVKSTLEDIFPEASYVGHCFLITKGKKPSGKRYYQYQLDELNCPKK